MDVLSHVLGIPKIGGGGGVAASTLLDGLAAYWKMDEAAGATRADSVGSSHALVNGTVSSVAGKVGNGASFNGNIANFLSVADNAAINPVGISFTLAFWYKLNANTSQGFVSKIGGGGGNEFLIDYVSTPVIRMTLYGSSNVTIQITPTAVDTTTFYAVRAWYDLATNKHWIQWQDLTPVSGNSPVGGINVSNGALRFGVWDGTQRPGNAVLDEIGFWRRTLTDQEWTEYLTGITYPFTP